MRDFVYNLGLRCYPAFSVLVAVVALWGVPCLVRDLPAGAVPAAAGAVWSASAHSSVSDHGGALANVQVVLYQSVLSFTKLRGGRSILTPIVRAVLLPASGWTMPEPIPVPFDPPADRLPPSARPLLAGSPDRAPPIL